MKAIVKETIIIILLVIVIFLLLAILFYEYMPISIAIPENVASYVTPNEIKDEEEQEIVQYSKQTVSFEITDSDLTVYKQSKSYDQSKANPFLPYYEEYYKLDSDSGKKTLKSDLDLGYKASSENTTSNSLETKTETETNTNTNTNNTTTSVFDTKLK